MIENVIHRIGGVSVFGIISICLFFAFFCGMLLWAISLKKNYLASMRALPLDGETTSANETSEKKNNHD